MAAETIAEFLVRGGTVEKSNDNDKVSLAELLRREGLLNQDDAQKLVKDLSDSFQNQIPKTEVI